MPKSDVFSLRLTKHEQWLLSYLDPEYPGQPLSQRIRNLLLDSAGAQLGVTIERTAGHDRTIVMPKKLGLKRGEAPVPRAWPVTK